MDERRTDEVDDEAAVAGAAGGVAEERLAVGWVAERGGRDEPHEVAGVGVRVAEAEDGREQGLGSGPADGVRAAEQARDGRQHDQEHGGVGDPHSCRPRTSSEIVSCTVRIMLEHASYI